MKHPYRLYVVIFICMVTAVKGFAQPSSENKHAGYAVGFTTMSFQEGNQRVIMHVWYPGMANGKPSRYSPFEYLQSFRKVSGYGNHKDSVQLAIATFLDEYGVDSLKIQAAMQKIAVNFDTVYPGAKALNKKFPVIIINSALTNEAIHHTRLASFLAAKGYVVALLGSGSANQRSTVLNYDTTGVNHQVSDIRIALKGIGQKIKHADVKKLAIISWSVGGIAAWQFAQQTGIPKLLISLDAAMGYAYGLDIHRQFKPVLKANPSIKMLHFSGKQGSVKHDLSFLASQNNGQISFISQPLLNHYHFTCIANFMNQSVSGNKETTAAYLSMVEGVYAFINKFL